MMTKLRMLIFRVKGIFAGRRADEEFAEEIEAHFALMVEENMRRGLSAEEARRAARLKMGSEAALREAQHDGRTLPWLESLWQDVRFALRMLRKNPGFTATAVMTLALGIGANTAIFTVIDSVLIEPLPFKSPAQLVALRESESAPGVFPIAGADYLDWQAQNQTFASMSLFGYSQGSNASGAGEPEVASVCPTQANFFGTLGTAPFLGRAFDSGEDVAGKNRVAMLSYAFWKRHFGGDRDVLGKSIELNNEAYVVVGVMPEWFNYPAATDIWTPIDMDSWRMHTRGSQWASAIGRLKNGVTLTQARADLLAISGRINQAYRAPNDQNIHSLVFPLQEYLVGGSQDQLYVLLGAVALVLLVACANIANLLLARSAGRVREMALRTAVGARRWRLVRQLLIESVLLALGGATLGAFGAWFGTAALNATQTLPIPRIRPMQPNATVFLVAIGISIVVGILSGVMPALHSTQLNLSEELKSNTRGVAGPTSRGRSLRDTLVVTEIAISLTLLIGAGLLLRSFVHLRSTNIGVNPENVLTMRINLPSARYKTAEDQKRFFDQLIARIEAVPGAAAASVSTEMALQGVSNGNVTVPGNANPKLANELVEDNWTSPEYFATFGIPLVEGRSFNEEDMQQAASTGERIAAVFQSAKDPSKVRFPSDMSYPVIVNETMAKLFWPNQDAIGKVYTSGPGPQQVVVGVVGDEKQGSIRRASAPENYLPLPLVLSFPGFSGVVSLRTRMAPASALSEVRSAVFALDDTIGVYRVRTMDDVIAESMQDQSLQTLVLGTFAVVALGLAAIGLYGVMSSLVTQRTHEVGIRMALGARRADVMRMMIGQGSKVIVFGLIIGIAGALGLTRLISTSLFGVTATDPATYIGVAALLAIVALAACYIPTRRAMRVDPMVALRHE